MLAGRFCTAHIGRAHGLLPAIHLLLRVTRVTDLLRGLPDCRLRLPEVLTRFSISFAIGFSLAIRCTSHEHLQREQFAAVSWYISMNDTCEHWTQCGKVLPFVR